MVDPCDFSVSPSSNWTWILIWYCFGSTGTGLGTRAWQFLAVNNSKPLFCHSFVIIWYNTKPSQPLPIYKYSIIYKVSSLRWSTVSGTCLGVSTRYSTTQSSPPPTRWISSTTDSLWRTPPSCFMLRIQVTFYPNHDSTGLFDTTHHALMQIESLKH